MGKESPPPLGPGTAPLADCQAAAANSAGVGVTDVKDVSDDPKIVLVLLTHGVSEAEPEK